MKPNGESAAYEQHAPNVKVYNYNWLVLMPAAPEEWPQLNCIVGGTAARMNESLQWTGNADDDTCACFVKRQMILDGLRMTRYNDGGSPRHSEFDDRYANCPIVA
jgi:hypothetical protein